MHRFLVHLPLWQFQALQQQAKTEGNSIASLIRQAIALFLLG
jgi:hypothetical protein